MLVRFLLIFQTIPFIWDLLWPPGDSYPGRLELAQTLLGLRRDLFLSGDFWQSLSYAFIHANWAHLAINVACILMLGSKLEHFIPKRSLWILTFLSVMAGGALFLLLTSYAPMELGGPEPQTLVGSSAICFAFLVFQTTVSPESKFLPFFLSGKSIGIAIILANLTLALLNPNLPTGPLAQFGIQLSENGFENLFRVSHACHLGGSLAGYLYGKWLLRPRVSLKSLKKAREKNERGEIRKEKPGF